MSKQTIFCLIAITAFTIVQAGTTDWWNSELSLQLDNTNFDEATKTSHYIAVYFYNKYSAECKNVALEFEKLAEKYMGPDRERTDVVIATIDGWAYENISTSHGVHVFPEILLFNHNGVEIYRYYNEYIAERMIDWVESILGVDTKKNDVISEKATTKDFRDITVDLTDPENPQIDIYYEDQNSQGKININTVVIDSVLTRSGVDELANKVANIPSDLQSAINDNLHKIVELMEVIASQKFDDNDGNDHLKEFGQMLQHLEEEMHSVKSSVDLNQPAPTRRYLEEVKVTLDEVRTQISENGEKSSWTSVLFAFGLLGGAALVYLKFRPADKKKVKMSVYD